MVIRGITCVLVRARVAYANAGVGETFAESLGEFVEVERLGIRFVLWNCFKPERQANTLPKPIALRYENRGVSARTFYAPTAFVNVLDNRAIAKGLA